MRHGAGQIYPLMLIGVLALLSFLLRATMDAPPPDSDGKLRHDPDASAENFTVSRFDAAGQLKYRLVGPYMEHYPDDDSSYIRSPHLTSFGKDNPPVTVSSKEARVTSGGKIAYLDGDVVVIRQAAPGRRPLEARMPDLTVEVEDNVAHTESPVEIISGPSWVKGTGMHLDNNASTLELKSRVTGQYIRSQVSP